MPRTVKLDALKQRFSRSRHSEPKSASGARVQKNLSLLKSDAERLKALAKRDRISQAKLLSTALDAYEAACRGKAVGTCE